MPKALSPPVLLEQLAMIFANASYNELLVEMILWCPFLRTIHIAKPLVNIIFTNGSLEELLAKYMRVSPRMCFPDVTLHKYNGVYEAMQIHEPTSPAALIFSQQGPL